jgi:RNA 3'-terminal phosphate cyclase (ATP)
MVFAGALHAPQQARTSDAEAASKVTIYGGTNVSKSPSFEYIEHVLLPMLAKVGLPAISANLQKRGWTNGRTQMGAVEFTVTPLPFGEQLRAWELTQRGDVERIEAYALVPSVCRRQMEHELEQQMLHFKSLFGDLQHVELKVNDSGDPKRFYLLLVAITTEGHRLGRDWLYDQKINLKSLDSVPSKLIKQVTKELEAEISHGGCVDEYMRDQLVVFQALADGPCNVDTGRDEFGTDIEGSLHTQTAEWVAQKILGKDPQ